MHQSKDTNWRYSGSKEKRRPRFVQDDWGVLEDIFEQRQHKIRKRARRNSGPIGTGHDAD